MNVKIRFNTNYPLKSDKKWRVIIDGFQHLADTVIINCGCYTSEDTVNDDDGNTVQKFHITCHPVDIKISPRTITLT